ncbi:MAG: nitroreductase [Bacteroidetes bacterium]|nr:nitroreductase [Bacteroidota bacterium]
MKFNLTDVQNVIRERRSVRPEQFKPRKVHRDQIEALIEGANWAPTHGQTEPWRFKVYTESGLEFLQVKLAEAYLRTAKEESFLQSKYDRIRNRYLCASAGIVVYMKRQASEKIPEIEEVLAVGCAVQNMSLIATSYGMSLFWSSGSAVYDPQFAEEMGIALPDRVLGVLYPGYPEGEWPEGRRQFWMTKVEWFSE